MTIETRASVRKVVLLANAAFLIPTALDATRHVMLKQNLNTDWH